MHVAGAAQEIGLVGGAVFLQPVAPAGHAGRSTENGHRESLPPHQPLSEAGGEITQIQPFVPPRHRDEIGKTLLRIVVHHSADRPGRLLTDRLRRQGKPFLAPFLAKPGRIGLREDVPGRGIPEVQERPQFGHLLLRESFHQRQLHGRADPAVPLAPGHQAFHLEQREQPRLLELRPRSGIEIERAVQQPLIITDQRFGLAALFGQLLDERGDRLRQCLRLGRCRYLENEKNGNEGPVNRPSGSPAHIVRFLS